MSLGIAETQVTAPAKSTAIVDQLDLTGGQNSTGLANAGQGWGWVFVAGGVTLMGFQTTTALGVVAAGSLPPMTNIIPNSNLAGSSGGLNGGNVGGNPVLGNIKRMKFAIRLKQTTLMRIWVGMGTSAGMAPGTYRSDTPAAQFVGFRYSPTLALDTKWECVTQTSSLLQTAFPESGLSHIDAINLHVLEFRFDGTTVSFFIDGLAVGSSTTNLPTVILAPLLFIDNAGLVGTPGFDFAYVLIKCLQ